MPDTVRDQNLIGQKIRMTKLVENLKSKKRYNELKTYLTIFQEAMLHGALLRY